MKIGVVGAAGRMGGMIIQEILIHSDECALSGATAKPGSFAVGHDIGTVAGIDPIGIEMGDDPEFIFRESDIVIDFTTPEATVHHAELAGKYKKGLVIGTTGLTKEQEDEIKNASDKAPIVYAANMSIGVNILIAAVEDFARRLNQEEFDIEIHEAHHKNKVDAPSGTALALGKAAASGRKVNLDDVAVYNRHGKNEARKDGEIGFSVTRAGDIIGEHTVTFAGICEQIELSHKASDRSLFAKGAVKAALWLKDKPKGKRLYSMQDVLGL